jgi:hypothetical protein
VRGAMAVRTGHFACARGQRPQDPLERAPGVRQPARLWSIGHGAAYAQLPEACLAASWCEMRLAPQSIPYAQGCVALALARVGVPPLSGRDYWPQGQ